jgi:hypothetical protein
MRRIVLALAALASLTVPVAAEPRDGTRADAERLGDLFIPYGAHPPTAQQRRADPDLVRYRGLTPREPGIRLTPREQVQLMRENSQGR